jgi:nucleotide-binding universal stress UspA family protein
LTFNILVPYDGSKPSDNAVRQALELAKSLKNGATVFLLHVIPRMHPHPSPEYGMKPVRLQPYGRYLAEVYEELEKKAKDMLDAKKKILDESSVKAQTHVFIGDPREHIITFAEGRKVDLIIIGGSGLGFFSKLKALGSISRGVAERAKCPVMIVH